MAKKKTDGQSAAKDKEKVKREKEAAKRAAADEKRNRENIRRLEKQAARALVEQYRGYNDPRINSILDKIENSGNSIKELQKQVSILNESLKSSKSVKSNLENEKKAELHSIESAMNDAMGSGKTEKYKLLKNKFETVSSDYDNKIKMVDIEISSIKSTIDGFNREIESFKSDIDAYVYELTNVGDFVKKYGSRGGSKQKRKSASVTRGYDYEWYDTKAGKYKNGTFTYSGKSFKVYVISFSYSWSLATKGSSQARQRQTVYPFRAMQSDLNVTLQFDGREELLKFADYARGYHIAVTSYSGLVGSGVPNMNFKLRLGKGDVVDYDVALPSIPVAQSNDSVAPTMKLTLKILRDEMFGAWVNDVAVTTQDRSVTDTLKSATLVAPDDVRDSETRDSMFTWLGIRR